MIHHEVSEKFPGAPSAPAVAGFYFVKGLLPILMAPDTYGVVESKNKNDHTTK